MRLKRLESGGLRGGLVAAGSGQGQRALAPRPEARDPNGVYSHLALASPWCPSPLAWPHSHLAAK